MSQFRSLILAMAVLALVVVAPRAVFAQQPTEAELTQGMTKALDEMRAHPGMKNMILGRIQSKAESAGAQNLDAKMPAVGARLDQAAALSDADYAAQKAALASQMVDILKGTATP